MNHRMDAWHSLALGLALVLPSLSAVMAADASGPQDKPNIVLIFADDLGWKDVGYRNRSRV